VESDLNPITTAHGYFVKVWQCSIIKHIRTILFDPGSQGSLMCLSLINMNRSYIFKHLWTSGLEHQSQSYYVVASVQSERDCGISVNHVLQRLTGSVVSISQLIKWTLSPLTNFMLCSFPANHRTFIWSMGLLGHHLHSPCKWQFGFPVVYRRKI